MITLISYAPGMSGDFLSYLLHQTPSYVPIDERIKDDHNRYFFPYLLAYVVEEIDDPKTWNKPTWPSNIKEQVDKVYNASICVPTHWYLDTSHAPFADHHVKLYTDDEVAIRKAYAFWWLKSHSWCTEPWQRRIAEVRESMPPEQAEELLNNYHNWKFLAFKMGIDLGDLPTYIKRRYEEIFRPGAKRKEIAGWENIDIAKVFSFETTTIAGVQLNEKLLERYVVENDTLLSRYNIIVDQSAETFFDTLYSAVSPLVSNKTHIDKTDMLSCIIDMAIEKNWVI